MAEVSRSVCLRGNVQIVKQRMQAASLGVTVPQEGLLRLSRHTSPQP